MPYFGDTPETKMMSASAAAYVHSGPGILMAVNTANGSTPGKYVLRDSSGGTVKLIYGHGATTPAQYGHTSPTLPPNGMVFTKKIHLTKTGGKKAITVVHFYRKA